MSTQDVLETKMRALFAKAKMPSSPALAAKIIELAENPNSTIEQFADLIQMDSALTAKLLRMTNSAACAQRVPVTTIQRAVALLGINRVRTVSLGFQLVSHVDRLGKCPFDMQRFWQRSVLRACLAQSIAEVVSAAYADEAFLIGLLQDCGIIVLVQILGRPYGELCMQADLPPLAFYAAERERFPHNHVEAIGVLAREWKLPDSVVTNLELQHTYAGRDGAPDDGSPLAAVSFLAGSMPWTDVEHRDTAGMERVHQARMDLGLSEEQIEKCVRDAAEAYQAMAGLLGDVLPDDLDVSDLLSAAIEQLSSSAEAERLEAAQRQQTLQSALGDYREKAARDPLTGALNRGALSDALRAMRQAAEQRSTSITILFIDLDNFKKLNDSLGHRAGDAVLKGSAHTFARIIPNAGLVGRYGGEEFLLAVAGLGEREAKTLADAVVQSVRETRFDHVGVHDPVTCSVGAVWFAGGGESSCEELVAKADHLMYEAKRGGKNQFRFQALSRSTDTDKERQEASAINHELAELDPPSPSEPGALRNIAVRLNQTESRHVVSQRKSVRRHLVVPCKLTYLRQPNLELVTVDAYTRNISTGGFAVVAEVPLVTGQPTEVAVISGDKPEFYVAGVVAFCRHIERAVHEIGLQIFSHKTTPILSDHPISALRELDWVATAIRSLAPQEASMETMHVPIGSGSAV